MKVLRSAWRWSWVVTLPLVVLFTAWVLATGRQWRTLVRDFTASPLALDLHGIGVDHAHQAWRDLLGRVRPGDLSDVPVPAQLRSIQLFISDQEQAKLDRDLPYSGFQWHKAMLTYADGLHEVELRYRGDAAVHWGFEKKSMRIRTATTDLFAGMRQFNLVVPKFPLLGDNYLAYRLARSLGLITPRCELVNVFRNGHLLGVYEFTEQLEEGTLRTHDRMPGDLYAGELQGRDARRGTCNQVFESPWLWEKLAANNHYDLESRVPLEQLCALLAEPQSEAAHARLAELLDLDVWGRFGAFELLAQTRAFDESRNWRLYWDPWRRKLEPVVQDPAGWSAHLGETEVEVDLDVAPSRLHAWLLANGQYLVARHHALTEFFDGSNEAFLAEVETTAEKLGYALHHDPNLRPANEAFVQAAVRRLPERLRRVLAAIRGEHLETMADVAWAWLPDGVVRVQINGRCPIERVSLTFAQRLASTPRVQVSVQHADGPHVVEVPYPAALATGTSLMIAFGGCGQSAPLWSPNCSTGARHCLPATFDIRLVDWVGEAPVAVFPSRGRGVGRAAQRESLPMHVHDLLFAAQRSWRSLADEQWSGEVLIDGVRDVHGEVEIAAGTIVRLGPKASLLFHGRVTARGTASQPIRFIPKTKDQDPWGTVALDGPGCSESVLQHCEFAGGSGYKVPLAEYCSMVSLHGCREVLVQDCRFHENHQYDDLVHVVYADVVFDRVVLAGARADALDCDISTVVIRDSSFLRSANDGVDLMTSRAVIENCRFEGNGDKGVSIGEGSVLLAVRCLFDGCGKALEAKDGSIAHALHCEVRRCGKAANAYKKNWRYDAGGELWLQRCVVEANGALPTADTWSRVEVSDSRVVGELLAEYEQEYVDGTSTRMRNTARLVDCDAEAPTRRRDALPFPAMLQALPAGALQAWQQTQGQSRGVSR